MSNKYASVISTVISMTYQNPTLTRLIAPLPFKSVLKTGKLSSFKLLILVLRRVIQLLPDSLFDLLVLDYE